MHDYTTDYGLPALSPTLMSETPTMTPQRPDPAAAPAPASGWAIELEKINKRFGAVHANKDIDLTVARGTIHGIVGENGAGKSTLMSILYGFYTADSGTIRVNGTPAHITDSRHALALGIGMVHQHFMLVDNFSVLENIVLGAEDSALLGTSLSRGRAELKRLAERIQSRGRSRCDHRGYFGGPAAARRNPQGAVSRRRYPHSGRADRAC